MMVSSLAFFIIYISIQFQINKIEKKIGEIEDGKARDK